MIMGGIGGFRGLVFWVKKIAAFWETGRLQSPSRNDALASQTYPTMKGFPLQPVGKGLGVCSKGVLKQP